MLAKRCFSLILLTYSLTPVSAEQNVHTLTSTQWNIPRDANSILAMPALQAVMHEFQNESNSLIVIKYAGGDEGTLWSSELRSWLVSLGIPTKNIELIPGATKTDQLELSVIKSQ